MLKTTCIKCLFNHNNQGCFFGKEVQLTDSGQQFVQGFCRNKRNQHWLGNRELEEYKLYDEISKEENAYSITLAITNSNFDHFKKTLGNIKQINIFTEIIVGLYKVTKEFLIFVLEELPKLNIRWCVEDIQNEEMNTPDKIHNYLFPHVDNHWFIQLENGDTIEFGQLCKVTTQLFNLDNNYVVCFLNDKKYLINKFVFGELGGHYDMNVIDKIKEFPNWEKVCLKI